MLNATLHRAFNSTTAYLAPVEFFLVCSEDAFRVTFYVFNHIWPFILLYILLREMYAVLYSIVALSSTTLWARLVAFFWPAPKTLLESTEEFAETAAETVASKGVALAEQAILAKL